MTTENQGYHQFDEQITNGEGRRTAWAAIGWLALIGSVPACIYAAYLIGR
jgi:hypothetical protein